jgi:hypothetical protein
VRATADSWHAANQRLLTAAVRLARARVTAHLGREPEAPLAELQDAVARAEAEMPSPSGLRQAATTFGLTEFERELLALCAACELDATLPPLLSQNDERRVLVHFGMALAALPDPHWNAITPLGPLRRYRLLDVQPGPSLVRCGLRIDERVLHFIAGAESSEERLMGLFEPLSAPSVVLPEHEELARRVATLWGDSGATVMLCGADVNSRRVVAVVACAFGGVRLHLVRAADLPAHAVEREALYRLWEREALLTRSALLIEIDDDDPAADVRRTVEHLPGMALVSCRDGVQSRDRMLVRVDVKAAPAASQRTLWRAAMGAEWDALEPHIDGILQQFTLSSVGIAAAAAALRAEHGDGDIAARAWRACRVQARARLDQLAQRIEAAAGWDDLVLPPSELQTLRGIAAHVRQRVQVYERWGFGRNAERGLGISALFVGQSGTGKTTAAEVLACELNLDLYRIDLSQVVSKYIGETEKNLRRVFDAAEESGAILLFDEADALFGKRSEVKDSHDRYANIEVSYLLQRMEAYRGLAILTSNLKEAIDTAFMRRLRMVVRFPFPDAAHRALLWEKVFPPQTPREGLDPHKLAKLHVPGGNIRNIALNAAFLAAEAGEPVRMSHLLRAARVECAKTEKTIGEHEIAGWV